MKKLISMMSVVISLLFAACQSGSKNEEKTTANQEPTTNAEKTNLEIPIASLYGVWTEPNPINEKEEQGFRLNKDGSAESINMATLLYRQWWLKDSVLYLVAESKGNRQSITDTTAYRVVNATDNELILRDRGRTVSYKKQ